MKSISVLSTVNWQEQEIFCFQGRIRSGRHSGVLWEFSVQMIFFLPEEVQISTDYLSGKFCSCNCLYTFMFHLFIHKGIHLFSKTASWLMQFCSISVSSVWPLLINGNLCFQKPETILSSEPERHIFICERWNKTTAGRETKSWVF